MSSLLIREVRMVDPLGESTGDLLVRNGVIAMLGKGLTASDVPVPKGGGRALLPAFVDLHAHFRDPGWPEAEDIASGSRAAAKGGYTAVSLMPNTHPVCDRAEVAQEIRNRARAVSLAEVQGAVTEGLAGERLADLAALAPHVWTFSNDGRGGAGRGCGGSVPRRRSRAGHFPSLPARRDLRSPAFRGADGRAQPVVGPAHRVSGPHRPRFNPGTVELVEGARARGVAATCEVTPHHLCVKGDYRVNPPLCDAATRARLGAALREGRIDAVATDHTPHTPQAKEAGAPGISGIETAFALLYTCLVREGEITLVELSRAMSLGPARILGLPKGRLEPGLDGDVVLIEDEPFTVTAESLLSRGKNTPLLGQTLRGKVWATVRRGRLGYLDGQIPAEDAHDH